MAQSTTNLGKIHVFPSETLYNQFKNLVADNDLALLKDDGAYIIAANLAQNGYVKFSNGLILQWGIATQAGYATAYPITFPSRCLAVVATYVLRDASSYWQKPLSLQAITRSSFTAATASSWGANDTALWIAVGM